MTAMYRGQFEFLAKRAQLSGNDHGATRKAIPKQVVLTWQRETDLSNNVDVSWADLQKSYNGFVCGVA